MSETYNGWSNYETWVATLWMDGDDAHWRENAEEILQEEDGDRTAAASELAQRMEDYHDEFAPETTGVYNDLLNAALNSVNWYEIAKHYIDDVEYESPDEIEE